jgi:hypothetical protein
VNIINSEGESVDSKSKKGGDSKTIKKGKYYFTDKQMKKNNFWMNEGTSNCSLF